MSSAPDLPQATDIVLMLRQGIDHHRQGRLADAESAYRDILAVLPDHFDALHLLGVAATQRGDHEAAVGLIRTAIAANPDHSAAHSNLGLALQRCGRPHEALASFDAALALNAQSMAVLYNRGNVLRELGRTGEALSSYDQALALNPDDPAVLGNRGNALRDLDRPADALASYDRALAHKPDDTDVLVNRGVVLLTLGCPADALSSLERALGYNAEDADANYHRGNALRMLDRFAEAIVAYERAIALRPALIPALNNRGITLQALDRPADALQSFDRALAMDPRNARVLNNRGNALFALKRHDDALASFDRAIALDNDNVDALNNRGNVLRELKRLAEALASYERALALEPEHADALINRGSVLRDLGRSEAALASYDDALSLRADNPDALYNRGMLLQHLRRYGEAADTFARLVALAPDYGYAIGSMHECRLQDCDWSNAAADSERIVRGVEEHRRAVLPFAFLAMSSSAKAQLRCARTLIGDRYPASASPLWRGERYEHERIRVAYLSADLREHPVAHLMAEVLERHDRRRFEIVAVAFGSTLMSPMRTRLKRAFDDFLEVSAESDAAVAQRLRSLEIDIAVDLTGITAEARTGVLARRPAPVQVNYLGYPGTMGADYIDYLIADRYLIPEPLQVHYAEAVMYLPETFQANGAREMAALPSRGELGLPQEGLVLCSFNNSYKITPALFEVWMRILKRVPGSVLWLAGGEAVARNLKREARVRGVSPERLVVAARVGYGEHLARCAVADLFLDTLPFNGGTTASDALWAGLPVLTCSGEALSARMAGSLLTTLELPELITFTVAEYEARAVALLTEPELLTTLRAKLARQRQATPLFDGERFLLHLEAGYIGMWERSQRCELPATFAVPAAA